MALARQIKEFTFPLPKYGNVDISEYWPAVVVIVDLKYLPIRQNYCSNAAWVLGRK